MYINHNSSGSIVRYNVHDHVVVNQRADNMEFILPSQYTASTGIRVFFDVKDTPEDQLSLPSNLRFMLKIGNVNYNLIGSAQFSKKSFCNLLRHLGFLNNPGIGRCYLQNQSAQCLELQSLAITKICVINLRQEFVIHVDNDVISFRTEYSTNNKNCNNDINQNKDNSMIVEQEQQLISDLNTQPYLLSAYEKDGFYGQDLQLTSNAITEEELIKGIQSEVLPNITLVFHRLTLLDHCSPNDESVDMLVKLFDETANIGTLYYVHCRAGQGRTSTILAMLFMLQQYKYGGSLSFIEVIDLVKRHSSNGHDLQPKPVPDREELRRLYPTDNNKIEKILSKQRNFPSKEARYQFLREFYEFVVNRSQHESWSHWKSYYRPKTTFLSQGL